MAKKNNDLASERKIHIIDDKTSPFVVTNDHIRKSRSFVRKIRS